MQSLVSQINNPATIQFDPDSQLDLELLISLSPFLFLDSGRNIQIPKSDG